MPNSIRLKKSGVAGKVPLVTDLSASELSYNYADGILYGKRTSGGVENVVEFAGSENHHLMKHMAAPGAPASGYLRFYAKSDNKLYTFNSIGQEHQILSGLLSGAAEGHTLVYTEGQWRSTDWIRLRQSGGYNTVEITSRESIDEFGDSQIYMSAEEGIYFYTNIYKPGFASVSINRYGITSSLLSGTGERFLVADAGGTIKAASVQPTQFWQRSSGILSPLNQDDEVQAWLFRTGGLIMADGYLDYGRSGLYTLYNDMVVAEFYLGNYTFYYANSRMYFNGITNLLTVEGAINADENYIAAGDLYLTNGSTPEVMFRRYLKSGANYVYLTSGYILGEVGFYASAASPNDYLKTAAIIAEADGHHSEKNFPTLMRFYTCPSGGVDGQIRMTIDSGGFVTVAKGMSVNSEYGNSYFIVNGAGSSSAPHAIFVGNNKVSVGHSGGAGDSSFNVNGAVSVKSRYITTTNQTLGEEYMVFINVSSSTSLYCPSASVSMDRMYFVANGGASSVTLRVPSGNYLNGVLNGTYTIKSQGLTIIHQGRAIGSLNWYAYELR